MVQHSAAVPMVTNAVIFARTVPGLFSLLLPTDDFRLVLLLHAIDVKLRRAGDDLIQRLIDPVMEISGHSSTRMLAWYTHPTEERKISALHVPAVATYRSQRAAAADASAAAEIAESLKEIGG